MNTESGNMAAEAFLPDGLDDTLTSAPFEPYYNNSLCDDNLIYCHNGSFLNITKFGNDSDAGDRSLDLFVMSVTSVILGLMILVTVIGNVFVIAAILLERNLQNVANYLIVSLAVADLMVACLVMPLGAVYVISKDWILGPELCDMWTSCDVLCCTASILHLVAIAVDRYWAVTDIDYIHTRNVNKIGIMIFLVWVVALVVSLAPQFGWKDPDYLNRINEQKCLVSQDVAYQIFATCSTFYVPLLVILFLYWKIFQTARKRIRKNRKSKEPVAVSNAAPSSNPKSARGFLAKKRFKRFKRSSKQSSATEALVSSSVLMEGQSTTTVDAVLPSEVTTTQADSGCDEGNFGQQVTTAFTISKSPAAGEIEKVAGSNNISPEKSSGGTTNNGSASHQSHISDVSRAEILKRDVSANPKCGTTVAVAKAVNPMQVHKEKKESLEAKRERKAAKTLAIITGAFVICWLPFFITAILTPLFGPISDHLGNFILWLGYFNSTLNPIIYTVFSPEFRQAFKRILFGAPRRNPHYRPGKADQMQVAHMRMTSSSEDPANDKLSRVLDGFVGGSGDMWKT